MIGILITLAIVLAAFAIVRRVFRKRSEAAAILDATPATDEIIEENIRRDMAPQTRPYGAGGKYMDSTGRKYLADGNGTLHRVVVTETGTPLLVRPWSKARRKAEKRKRNAQRYGGARTINDATTA